MTHYPELVECRICPRNCGVNRYLERGFCKAPASLAVNLSQLHFGEEPPISGTGGSGTIFFSFCNLQCVYCQNYSISCEGYGKLITEQELIDIMMDLQERGAHNINLVTPTHYSPVLQRVLAAAKTQELKLPILWNSSAYEHPHTLQSLQGLVDIYLPDLKYYHGIYAKKYSHAADYPALAFSAIKEMYRQVGFLQTDELGIARKGLLLRLLVLPNGLSGTCDTLRKILDEFGPELPLSLMAQYYPAGTALSIQELSRGISATEYQKVLDTASELGFTRIYAQELSCNDEWTPRFCTDSRVD